MPSDGAGDADKSLYSLFGFYVLFGVLVYLLLLWDDWQSYKILILLSKMEIVDSHKF